MKVAAEDWSGATAPEALDLNLDLNLDLDLDAKILQRSVSVSGS